VAAVLVGREAYRRTQFVVLRQGLRCALVRVERVPSVDLFAPITAVEWLAGPDECEWVESPGTDTANATALWRAARERGSGRAVCVVEGRYHHVNFIHRPEPLALRVVEVIPPDPPKLHDMAARVVDFDELLPPVELVLEPVDIRRLAASAPGGPYLLPCRGSGIDLDGPVDFLDERPPARKGWTLIGCERSRQFHRWFYGTDPDSQVELCPARLHRGGGPTLLKCCLLEGGLRRQGETVTVPWGASLADVQEALRLLTGVS
jgi:hypothetical protein